MKEWTREELDKLYAQVQKKAATDKKFREELLSDANAAIVCLVILSSNE